MIIRIRLQYDSDNTYCDSLAMEIEEFGPQLAIKIDGDTREVRINKKDLLKAVRAFDFDEDE